MFVKCLMKFDLELHLKFGIFGGKRTGEILGEDFSTGQESTGNFGENFRANFGANFGGVSETSLQMSRLFLETSFSTSAVLMKWKDSPQTANGLRGKGGLYKTRGGKTREGSGWFRA